MRFFLFVIVKRYDFTIHFIEKNNLWLYESSTKKPIKMMGFFVYKCYLSDLL